MCERKQKSEKQSRSHHHRSACSEGQSPNDSSVSVLCSGVLRSCVLTQCTANWYHLIYIFSPVATWWWPACCSLVQTKWLWMGKQEGGSCSQELLWVLSHTPLGCEFYSKWVVFVKGSWALGWQWSYCCKWVGVGVGLVSVGLWDMGFLVTSLRARLCLWQRWGQGISWAHVGPLRGWWCSAVSYILTKREPIQERESTGEVLAL